MAHKLELPKELEPFLDKLEASVKPFVKIIPTKSYKLTLWQSKFGGLPYLPKGCEYPKDTKGNPLFLLAQIDFEEVPYLEGFPTTGILQFYIADNDMFGANLDNPTQQQNFRVVYFPIITKALEDLVTDFSFLAKPKSMPLSASCSLRFEKKLAPISTVDYEFGELFGDNFFEQFGDKEDEIWGKYTDKFASDGHKIGGYPFFTQEDPRERLVQSEKYILLLQIDTDDSVGIIWGDSGVSNFFITKKDLENLDFSGVLYNWDCS